MPNQRRQLLAYCERREWEVVEEYDDAKTGTNGARREFQRLIERATDGSRPFDVIVVYAFSRFFRDEIELELTVRLLRKHGVRLVSITQEVRDDPTGNLVRRIFALFDEYDSVETGKHVARSLAENARQGFWNGSRPPFGHKTVVAEQRGATLKKRLAMNPVEARIVREVFDRALKGTPTGHTGVKAITSWLNDNGYRTRGGAPWGIGPVHRMLTDTIYKGQFIFNRDGEEPIAVPAPSIINTRLFDDVQAKLKSRSPKIKPPRLETSDVLLSVVAKCAGCGGSMTLRTGKSGAYRYYACSTAQRIGKTGCRGRAIPCPSS